MMFIKIKLAQGVDYYSFKRNRKGYHVSLRFFKMAMSGAIFRTLAG
jgi:hypothetical protein